MTHIFGHTVTNSSSVHDDNDHDDDHNDDDGDDYCEYVGPYLGCATTQSSAGHRTKTYACMDIRPQPRTHARQVGLW